LNEISDLVSRKLVSSKPQIEGIVESTTEGPVMANSQGLTHYEMIGLILYASEKKTNTAAQITKLLATSGIKCMVPGRLNEMMKKDNILKPDPVKPKFSLTAQGQKWVENEVARAFVIAALVEITSFKPRAKTVKVQSR
jgi:hypothetical protein